ncbi:lipocalin family protein [Vibrio sp. SS-MA-C1-2]|uniref:lipocalin family protein n=1 Tax=Vibrio sp. SS-MA-C1-2 TaxID=2908646 RepID=UPI001F27394C|nr:lipocalin family protein [Vibrio sp. SS-MA-C1-2]UJF17700.1 lipocalin family protein [Vibrio sp. SS-MA-C1-2]
MKKFIIFCLLLLTGCVSKPESVEPVKGFELDKYLGKWYEIARLDHSFERSMEQVTASYSLRPDGGVRVINRGFSLDENKWKEAEGKAYFVEDKETGYLKVSFFGPFYGSYIIFNLDKENYQYAFVSSYNHDYLWLLSRTPTIERELMERFVVEAKALGFNTDNLIIVSQESVIPDEKSSSN